MDHQQTPYPPTSEPSVDPNDATEKDGATVLGTADAPSWHDAKTVPLTEFSLTRKQVVELYAAAGIKVEERTVTGYAQQGILRATKVDAERGLKRYLFDKASVEADIVKRLKGPGSVYAHVPGDLDEGDSTVPSTDAASSPHGAGTMPTADAPSPRPDRVRALEIENARLEGRVTEKERQHQENLDALDKVRAENGQLRLGYGTYKGRVEELERRLALLEAPKAADPEPPVSEPTPVPEAPPAAAPEPHKRGLWRRITGKA